MFGRNGVADVERYFCVTRTGVVLHVPVCITEDKVSRIQVHMVRAFQPHTHLKVNLFALNKKIGLYSKLYLRI